MLEQQLHHTRVTLRRYSTSRGKGRCAVRKPGVVHACICGQELVQGAAASILKTHLSMVIGRCVLVHPTVPVLSSSVVRPA